jgi:hypothetical protein
VTALAKIIALHIFLPDKIKHSYNKYESGFQIEITTGGAIMSRILELLLSGFLLCLCTGCAVNPITGEEELMLFSLDYRWLLIDLVPGIDICND